MTARYARGTVVSAEKSRAEVEEILKRYGCDQFLSGWNDQGAVFVGFRHEGRMVRLHIPMPSKDEKEFVYSKRSTWKRNTELQRQTLWEQACRERWRAVCLIVKAKIEAIQCGISTFEREFLADILLPDGSTVGQFIQPQIESAYENGSMPRSLPLLLTDGGRPD